MLCAVSLAAKEAHTNSMNYAKERMGALYSCAWTLRTWRMPL